MNGVVYTLMAYGISLVVIIGYAARLNCCNSKSDTKAEQE